MKKNAIVLAIITICLLGPGTYIMFFNIPLRTHIYRSVFKGNWSLCADGDTIYASGYCGIRKYLITPEGNKLLCENESFLQNRIVGHGLDVNNNYIYLACRSYLPGPDKNDKAPYEGELIVLNKANLNIISQFFLPSKMNDAVCCDSTLLLSGINRFYLFNISDPQYPQIKYEYVSDTYKEFQGSTIWKANGRRYAAFTLFTLGVEIWDITNTDEPVLVKKVPLSEACNSNNHLQSLDIIADYPYLYATIAPMKNQYLKKYDLRGVLQIDVSNINNIKYKAYYIPRKDFWKPMSGDAHPKSIAIYNGNIYLSAATCGSAIFGISPNKSLEYKGIMQISSPNEIYPICISDNGYIISGDWVNNKIYSEKIN